MRNLRRHLCEEVPSTLIA
ncbi:Protein of unknown function [Gryllus bimaculatus]|nr:Protein of unknown function [Gryllus bimaculatus]